MLFRSNATEEAKVALILDLLGTKGMEVPDPWYGGMQDFKDTFKMLDEACDRIINELMAHQNNS